MDGWMDGWINRWIEQNNTRQTEQTDRQNSKTDRNKKKLYTHMSMMLSGRLIIVLGLVFSGI